MFSTTFYAPGRTQLRMWAATIYERLLYEGHSCQLLHSSTVSVSDAGGLRDGEGKDFCIDISVGGYKTILSSLGNGRSQVLIMFSIRSMLDLLIVRTAKQFGHIVIYVQHSYPINDDPVLSVHHIRSKKLIIFTFRRYVRAAKWYLQFLARKASVTEAFAEITILRRGLRSGDFSAIGVDHAVLFTPESIPKIRTIFGLSQESIQLCSFPGAAIDSLPSSYRSQHYSREHKRIAVYIHQPFILDGISELTYEAELRYIASVSDIIRGIGFHLVLSVHPRESVKRYQSIACQLSLDLNIVNDLSLALRQAEIAIGHTSTGILLACAMHIPVYIIPYSGVSPEQFAAFDCYGSRVLSIDDLSKCILSNSKNLLDKEDLVRPPVGHHESKQAMNIEDAILARLTAISAKITAKWC